MTNQNNTIKFYSGESIPVELHKVRVVQKLFLKPVDERKTAMENAGFNTFLLNTKDVFLDANCLYVFRRLPAPMTTAARDPR